MKNYLTVVYKASNGWDNYSKEEQLSEIIIDSCYSYDGGKLEEIDNKVDKSIKFTENLLTLLYKKGLLQDEDITDLVRSYIYDLESNIVIKLNSNEI